MSHTRAPSGGAARAHRPVGPKGQGPALSHGNRAGLGQSGGASAAGDGHADLGFAGRSWVVESLTGAGADRMAGRNDGPTAGQFVALQGTAGNRAISAAMRSVIQRVPMTDPNLSETLYNKENKATGAATAGNFGNTVKYDMARVDDTGVTVTIRIKFMSQSRNSQDPNAPGAAPNTPALGALTGSPAEIPTDDPDNRRAWAADIAGKATNAWNGHLTLVEDLVGGGAPAAGGAAPRPGAAAGAPPAPVPAPTPAPAAGPGDGGAAVAGGAPAEPKKLPVTFAAVPVFGKDDPADSTVIVHPMAVVAGTPGQPIDSGNYYMNKGTSYGDNDAVIAAHEYGHLLGIPDEYSQSNAQLNALIHQAAPGGAPSVSAALDRATVQHMVLSSLKQPLLDQLTTSLGPITVAFQAQKGKVRKAMIEATRAGVVDASVTDALTSMLAARSTTPIAPGAAAAIAFETTKNFSSSSIGGGAIDTGFSAAGLTDSIRNAYWAALLGGQGGAVGVDGVGDTSINVASSVGTTTAVGGANVASAAAVATTAVSGPAAAAPAAAAPAAGGAGTAAPGLPAIAPPANLVSQLSALPATWDAAGSLLETGVTSAAFVKAMAAYLKSADAASAVSAAALPPGVRARKKSATTGAMYRRAYTMVQQAANGVAAQIGAGLVGDTLKPVLTASVTQLMSTIDDEVKRIMVTPPAGVAALGTPDPNMTAMVSAMKAKLDADKAATAASPGRDPLKPGAGGSAPDQEVTYSALGLMGSSATTALRADQFAPIVANFNTVLLQSGEHEFKAKTS